MKIWHEICTLEDMNFNGQAEEVRKEIIEAGKGEKVMQKLSEVYPEGMKYDEFYDLFWLEHEWLYKILEMK